MYVQMSVSSLVDSEIQSRSLGSKHVINTDALQLLDALVEAALENLPPEGEKHSSSFLRGAFDRYVQPNYADVWELKPFYDALDSSPNPIDVLKELMVKRVIAAMYKMTPWKGTYYHLVHAIYTYDPVLRRMWKDILLPTCLMDLESVPQKREIRSLISSESARKTVQELMAQLNYSDEGTAPSAIRNVARWVCGLARELPSEKLKSLIESIKCEGGGETPIEDLYIKVLRALILQIGDMRLDNEPVSFLLVAHSGANNRYFPELATLLNKETLVESQGEDAPPKPRFHLAPKVDKIIVEEERVGMPYDVIPQPSIEVRKEMRRRRNAAYRESLPDSPKSREEDDDSDEDADRASFIENPEG